MALESIFFGCQDFCPSICEQVLISLKLLLLLLHASCSGNKPALEALLLCGVFGYAELIVAEANLVFGEGYVVVLLRIPVRRLFVWAAMPVFLFGLLEGGLFRVVFIVGTVRIIIVSGAGIALAGLGAALATPMLCFLFGGLSSVASSPFVSFGVSTRYISYEEVAVHRPVSGGSCMSPALSSMSSMSSK